MGISALIWDRNIGALLSPLVAIGLCVYTAIGARTKSWPSLYINQYPGYSKDSITVTFMP